MAPVSRRRSGDLVNLKEMMEMGDGTPNVLLEQDDIIYLPLNPLAAVGVAMQNLLMPAQPVFNAAAGVQGLKGF